MFSVYASMDQRLRLSGVAEPAHRAEALGPASKTYAGLCDWVTFLVPSDPARAALNDPLEEQT
ncbi:MAG: hypothetical protein VX614_02025 [Myxococcota bacterium]|nr:hypothetical protein [Myxococcota bacterium]